MIQAFYAVRLGIFFFPDASSRGMWAKEGHRDQKAWRSVTGGGVAKPTFFSASPPCASLMMKNQNGTICLKRKLQERKNELVGPARRKKNSLVAVADLEL